METPGRSLSELIRSPRAANVWQELLREAVDQELSNPPARQELRARHDSGDARNDPKSSPELVPVFFLGGVPFVFHDRAKQIYIYIYTNIIAGVRIPAKKCGPPNVGKIRKCGKI